MANYPLEDRVIINFDKQPILDTESKNNVLKHPNTIEVSLDVRAVIKPGATARIPCPFELELGENIIGVIHLKQSMDEYKLTLSANLIHNGFDGRPTICVTNRGDKALELMANEPLAQIHFIRNPPLSLLIRHP